MKIFLVFKIFWSQNCDLFQVRVQLMFKCEVDYIMFSIFGREWPSYTLVHWVPLESNKLKLFCDRLSLGQSVLVSAPQFLLLSDIAVLMLWGTLPDERTGL
jgi:hypothetical protein